MLLKPSEIEYVDIVEEKRPVRKRKITLEETGEQSSDEVLEDSSQENEDESEYEEEYIEEEPELQYDEKGIHYARTIIIGGSGEPIYYDDEQPQEFPDEKDEITLDEEFIFGDAIVLGQSFVEEEVEYPEIGMPVSELDESLDETLYDFDTGELPEGFDSFEKPDYQTGQNITDLDALGSDNWDNIKHATLMGKVDNQLVNKLKAYREDVHEMSDEKLSLLEDDASRSRLLDEAAMIAEEMEDGTEGGEIDLETNIKGKMDNIIKKCLDEIIEDLTQSRIVMIEEVESEIENVITERINTIKEEAEEHIDETVLYYKKKLESDNQSLSTANNIISRREQILDEAYAKSLRIVEDAEQKAQDIIENSSRAQDEADMIIAESEQKGEIVIQEAQMESERIISESNLESARIIQAAEDQHQDIVEAATQDGFSVGYQEGKEEAIKENAQLLKEALNALNKLYAALPIAIKQNEERIVNIAYQIAESIILDKTSKKDELCAKALKRATKIVSNLEDVKVKINPADLDNILPKQEILKSVIPDVPEFVILGDDSVMQGDCVFNAISDTFNISIRSQIPILDAICAEVLEEGY